VKRSNEAQLQFLESALRNGVKKAAEEHFIPLTTAYRWYRAWDPVVGVASVKRTTPGPPKGKNRKLIPRLLPWIDQIYKENNTRTGKQIARMISEEKNVWLGKSTVNGYLASKDITYKVTAQEDVSRNDPTIINERWQFAKRLLENGERPDDPDRVIYWDISYFETCMVARHARAKRGCPAVVPKGHRSISIKTTASNNTQAKLQKGAP